MKPYKTYQDFFLFYLNEHSKPLTRAFHYVGTTIALTCIAFFVVTFNAWFLLTGLITAYGMAWISHFTIEHNKPATFTYPVWSYIADHHMLLLALTGRLRSALDDAQKRFS